MKSRTASSACRPIGAYSPVRESERPRVIFTESGSDFRDAALDDGLAVGIESFVGEDFAPVALAIGPDFGSDSLAGQHRTRKAHAQTLQASRVTGAKFVDRDLRRERHRAEAVHDDARETSHLRDVFIDVNRIRIAGSLRVPEGLILVDGLRDTEHRSTALRLDRPRFSGCSVAVSSASNKNDEVRLLNRLTFLIGGAEFDGHSLAGRFCFDRNNFRGRGDDVAGANRIWKFHVLLAVNEPEQVDVQVGIYHGFHESVPGDGDAEHRRRDDADRAARVEECGVVVVVRARVFLERVAGDVDRDGRVFAAYASCVQRHRLAPFFSVKSLPAIRDLVWLATADEY